MAVSNQQLALNLGQMDRYIGHSVLAVGALLNLEGSMVTIFDYRLLACHSRPVFRQYPLARPV
jgi:hypothetical protein